MTEDERLQRKLDRERRARAAAEAIAERVTGELYKTVGELQRANDDVETMNRSMRDFVAIASHDLRGPITSIIGFAQLLDDSWDRLPDEKRRECVTVIERQSHALSALVEDLLTSSAIDAGALDTHREAVPLRDLLTAIIDDFAPRCEDVHLHMSGDHVVRANPDHLRRMVLNYLENAVKYGDPPIDVAVVAHEGSIELRVCDVGEGVPDSFVPDLFARFTRADPSGSRRAKGTGLGLSIVAGLAKANEGQAWFEPNEPTGSRFCLRLPQLPQS